MMGKVQFVNPYQTDDAFHVAAINLDKKTHTMTLEQLKSMNLSPTLERAYFGRTSEEWEKALQRAK